MTTKLLGRVAPLYKGNYSNSTNYIKFDVVFDGESSFISKQGTAEAPNVGHALTDEAWWGLLCKGNYLAIQPLTDRVTELEADLTDLQTDVSGLDADTVQLRSDLSDLQTDSAKKFVEVNNKTLNLSAKLDGGIIGSTTSYSGGATYYCGLTNKPLGFSYYVDSITYKKDTTTALNYALVTLGINDIIESITKGTIDISVTEGTVQTNIKVESNQILFIKGVGFLLDSGNIIFYDSLSSTGSQIGTLGLKISCSYTYRVNSGLSERISVLESNQNEFLMPFEDESSIITNEKIEKNYDNDLSTFIDLARNGTDIYYEAVKYTGVIKSIQIKGTRSTNVDFYVANIDIDNLVIIQETKVATINISAGTNTYDISSLNIQVTAGQYIGINYPSSDFYFKNLSNNIFVRRRGTSVTMTTYRTAENFIIDYQDGFVTVFNTETITEVLENHHRKLDVLNLEQTSINENVEILSNKIYNFSTFKFNYQPIYKSSNFSDWSDFDHDLRGSWNKSNNTIIPTSIGGYVSNYLCGAICYNKAFESDKIIYKFNTALGVDTILNIHFVRKINTGALPNESMFAIDCPNNRLVMYSLDGRYITTNIGASKTLDFNIVAGRIYSVECIKNDITFKLRLIDQVTGQTTELIHFGNWDCGSMLNRIAFSWGGGVAPIISKVRIYEPVGAKAVIVGDSITAGTGMTSDFPNRYSAQMVSAIQDAFISASPSATIGDIINRFDNEFALIKPNNLVICIGRNDISSSETYLRASFQTIKDKCIASGINLILNHIPCSFGYTSEVNLINSIIDEFNLDGAKFDVATAVENNTSLGCNGTMFVDGTHPNLLGSNAMFDRTKIDLSFLYE